MSKAKKALFLFLFILLLIIIKEEASAQEFDIDGDKGDWENYPSTYCYNWDNSMNCWEYGVWINGEKYMTPYGEYDTNVRHKIQLAMSNDYIYIAITFTKGSDFNGSDYQLTINDIYHYDFQVVGIDNSVINTQQVKDGIYKVYLKNKNNFEDVASGKAYLRVDNAHNNFLELKISLKEIADTFDIDYKTIQKVGFFTPNLMYEKIEVAGVSTFPLVLMILMIFLLIFIKYIKYLFMINKDEPKV